MIGMNKDEIVSLAYKLDKEKYTPMVEKLVTDLLRQYGPSQQFLNAFLKSYINATVIPMAADLIAANNHKVEQDIEQLLSQKGIK